MKRLILLSFCMFILSNYAYSQALETDVTTDLPYETIGEYPVDHKSGNIMKRMLDGLGYRYYWATDSLTVDDLNFKPGETNRTTEETLDHLFGLSKFILKVSKGLVNERGAEEPDFEWVEKRKRTLHNFHDAALLFSKMNQEEIENSEIKLIRGENESSVAFWHVINGPIADALTHVGQIVSNRRASGNPLDPRVNVFMGKNR